MEAKKPKIMTIAPLTTRITATFRMVNRVSATTTASNPQMEDRTMQVRPLFMHIPLLHGPLETRVLACGERTQR